MNKPPYLERLMDALAENLPKDASYVVIVQRDNEDSPHIVSTIDDENVLGQALRSVAARLGGDN